MCDRWVSAWGKFPSSVPVAWSNSSANSPRSLAVPDAVAKAARASAVRPWRARHLKLYDDMQAVFSFLWTGLREERTYLSWTEVNELLMIFRGRPDRIPANAWRFIDRAWDTIGVA